MDFREVFIVMLSHSLARSTINRSTDLLEHSGNHHKMSHRGPSRVAVVNPVIYTRHMLPAFKHLSQRKFTESYDRN